MTMPINSNDISRLESHEYADIFPMASPDDYSRLVEDVAKNGLIEPIWLFKGKILDGRNRYKACLDAGITPEFREYRGDEPLAFAVSQNLTRRHLTSGQCTALAIKIKPMLAVQANERKLAGLKQNQTDNAPVVQKIGQRETKNNPLNQHATKANTQAAKTVGNTNAEYIRKAEKFKGTEAFSLLEEGLANVPDAEKVSKLEPEKQRQVAERAREGEKVGDALKKVTGTGSFHVSSKNNDWYTPSKYIESARAVMGSIDTDPATSELAQKTVKADVFFTSETNGLDKDWQGNVWMNPPYSMPEIAQFIDKLIDSGVSQWIVLTNNSSDTGWFHKLLKQCDATCFTRGRVGFENVSADVMATRQGQTFFYKGSNLASFIKEFSAYGAIMRVIK